MTTFPDVSTLPFIRDLLDNDPISFCDCGAAGGIDPLFSRLPGGGHTKTYGFEPSPEQFKKLAGDKHTVFFDTGISDRDGVVEFNCASTVSSIIDKSDEISEFDFEKIEIQISRLEGLADKGTILPPNILKTDLEGHDFHGLMGAGRYLRNSVLCVKSEIQWQTSAQDGGFSAIHDLLIKNGLLFFGQTYNQSFTGMLQGGDVIYLRSIDSILGENVPKDQKRSLLLKLVVISNALYFIEYAEIAAAKARIENVISDSEYRKITEELRKTFYVPEAVIPSRPWSFLSTLLSLASILLAGWKTRSKTMSKSNQLRRYSRLFISSRIPLFRQGRRDLKEKIEAAIKRADKLS